MASPTSNDRINGTCAIPSAANYWGGGSGGGLTLRRRLGGGGEGQGSGRSRKPEVVERKAATARGRSQRSLAVKSVGLLAQ